MAEKCTTIKYFISVNINNHLFNETEDKRWILTSLLERWWCSSANQGYVETFVAAFCCFRSNNQFYLLAMICLHAS